MKTVKLNNDVKIPVIGLGTWRAKPGEVYKAIRWAIKVGYQQIDCAPVYGNEVEIGQAIHDAINEGDIKREQLFVTSKLWNDAHAPAEVLPALKKTLNDLQLEYLDLYLMHWPVALKKGVEMPQSADDMISLKDQPLDLTWAEMERAQLKGLVRSIGVSNFGPKKLADLIEKSEIVPAVNQVEYHPLLQQKELVDFCRKNGIALVAYSPLGSGKDVGVLNNPIIVEMSQRLKITPAQLVLAWGINNGVVVIPKSIHAERIQENYGAMGIKLDDADMEKIATLDEGKRILDGKILALGDYTVENIFE